MKWIVFLLFFSVAIVSLALLSIQDPGAIVIAWLGYEVKLTVVMVLLCLLLFFFILILLGRVLSWLLGAPLRWLTFFRRSQELKAKQELLELLSFYEAEEFTNALHHQKKAAQHLSSSPFFLWISGNAFEKAEKPFEAEKCYIDLTKDPAAAFLGFKGQIRAALHRGDFSSAYNLLHHAEKLASTSPWVLKHFLALAREQKNFEKAESLIFHLEDLGYLPADQSKKQRAKLHYQQALQPETLQDKKEILLRQSHLLDPSFTEATETLAPLLQEQGHTTYALNIIEATWNLSPTQALGDLYLQMSLPQDDVEAYQIAKNLVKKNRKNPESLLFLARTALKAKLW